MHRTALIALAAAMGLLLAATPAAAEDLPQTSRFFEEYDRDADGFVTEQEFDGSGEVFRLLDKDKDGRISTTELGLPADYRPDPNAKRRREQAERRNRRRGGRNAQDRLKRLRQLFKRADVDKDGVVTKQEWRGDASLFERLDRNGDGKLDSTDYPALAGGMEMDDDMMGGAAGKGDKPGAGEAPGTPEPNKGPRKPATEKPEAKPGRMRELTVEQVRKRFQELDKDADQQLTAEDGINERLLRRMDADESGGVSLAEFEAAVEKAKQQRARPARGAGMSPDRIRKMLQRFDQDRDGKVSRDEFPGSDERFERMDVNKDGCLSEADFAEPEKEAPKPGKKRDEDAPTTPGTDKGK